MRELAKVVEDVEEGLEACLMSTLREMQTMQKGVNKLDAICARLQTLVHQNGEKEPFPPANTPKGKEGKSHGDDNADVSCRRKRKSSKPRSIHNLAVVADVGFDKDDISEYEINNRDVDFSPYINQNGDDLEDCLQESPNHPVSTNGSAQGQKLDKHSPVSVPASEGNPTVQGDIKEPAGGIVGSKKQGGDASEVGSSAEATVSKDGPKKELASSADASVLKGYAEDTMNELLSIYGLDNQAEAITKSVPLQNFSSRKILERSSPAQKGKVKQEFNNYQKFVESVAKLQELPKGSVIGNPPVLLPSGHESMSSSATVTSSPQNKSPKSGSTKNKHLVTPESKKTPLGRHASPGDSPGYTKYMKRFSSHHDCGGTHCQDMNYKDHYHCLDCSYRVFVKKEEMIRHYKWHKKRDDSLQHGFMRYSPLDDCTVKFGPCTHYGKQTHYHCLQTGCDKVYISTSDVQMHANYHRKASAIISEGFQRFRATEDCGTPSCQFYGQRTTHFHCRRSGCKFTFKNKADMEKHKSYHQKDEILSKDGFKKFMKYETCGFDNCKYSKVSNHIHCIRPGCDYVLHSTGQLYAHKRKHERKDFELAYHGYSVPSTSQYIPHNPEFVKLEDLAHMTSQESMSTLSPSSNPNSLSTSPIPSASVDSRHHLASLQNQVMNLANSPLQPVTQTTPQPVTQTTPQPMASDVPLDSSLNLNISGQPQPQRQEDDGRSACGSDKPRDEMWKQYLVRYTANDHCHSRCELLYKDHYHCQSEGCQQMFRSKEGVRDHARLHKFQDTITEYSYKSRGDNEECDEIACRYNLKTKHYHCTVPNCSAVVTNSEPFDRLKHFKTHEIPTKFARLPSRNTVADALKRKRGRPPKYQRDHIPVVPRPIIPAADVKKDIADSDPSLVFDGFKMYEPGELCPDALCMYHSRVRHWHCLQPRCHHATDRPDVLNIHKKDFHGFVHIREGFEFFDRNVNCRRSHCHNNKANRHFHCVRPKCDYSFVRHTTMQQHERRHVTGVDPPGVLPAAPPADAPPQMILIPVNKEAVDGIVKSAGTFYPQHLIGQPQTVSSAQPIQIIQTTAGPIAVTIPTIQTTQTDPPSVNAGLDQGVATTSNSKDSQVVSTASDSLPLARLLKQTTQLSRQDWMMQLSKMHFSMLQNCGRPFCKLKKRNHYHCSECNQAFTEEVKLHTHIMNKHRLTSSDCSPVSMLVKTDTSEGAVTEDDSVNSGVYDEGSLNLSNVSDEVMDTSSVTPKSGRKRKRSWKFIETDPSKPKRIHSPREKADVSVPPGYVRVRFDENCSEEKCSYRQLQTHYHCTRDDCKYGFSDRSRMLPHTLRHERIDKIMGSDFRQFRANLDCEHEACVFRQKSSHFHCLKCEFMCCDTNRVIGHRKHHSKMDGYRAQGFTKTAGTQDCEVAHCPHKTKQTHYHCIQPGCTYAVLTPSQMPPHKFRHDMEAKQSENGDQNVSL